MAGKAESGVITVMVIVALVTVAAIVGVAVFFAVNADKITNVPAVTTTGLPDTTDNEPGQTGSDTASDKPTGAQPTEPPKTEPPVTEKPVTEKPVTEKPVTEKPVTEKPVTTTEPVTTEPTTTEPEATTVPATTEPIITTEPIVTTEPVVTTEPIVTTEPVIIKEPVIKSGEFYGTAPMKADNSGRVSLKLFVEWESSYIEGEDEADLTLRVYLESYKIGVGERKDSVITLNGAEYKYNTDRFSVTGSSKTLTLLYEDTFRVSVGDDMIINADIEWKAAVKYTETEIKKLTASQKITVN